MNGRREWCRACVSKAMGSYPDRNRNLQLCLTFPSWEGTSASSASDRDNSNTTALFACLTYFCFTPLTNKCCAAMTMAILVWDFRSELMWTFKCLNITDSTHAYHHTHIHKNTWLIFIPFCSSLLGWLAQVTVRCMIQHCSCRMWLQWHYIECFTPPAQQMAVKAQHYKLV